MCFVQNFVDGEKLKYVDASKLPEMGVTDWEHVKVSGVDTLLHPNPSAIKFLFTWLTQSYRASLPLLPAANRRGHSNALAAERA